MLPASRILTPASIMLRYWTAGESHGKTLIALVDGFPAGVTVDVEPINVELRRRQGGYGRGGRQRIETDAVNILSGVWKGVTLGSPIALEVPNRDNKLERLDDLPRPRPGHGDLTGAMKYLGLDPRRAGTGQSARETAVRVAAGALAKQLLAEFGITAFGYVVELGGERIEPVDAPLDRAARDSRPERSLRPESRSRRGDQAAHRRGRQGRRHAGRHRRGARRRPAVRPGHARAVGPQARRPAGPGGDGRAGDQGRRDRLGFEAARRRGSQVHDPIQYDESQRDSPNLGFVRPTNNAGGLEGGMTNGQPLVIRAAKKPISTLARPLESINLDTKQKQEASYERSDVCAVPAASVIVENVVAFEVACALVDKFGGDSLPEMKARYELYLEDGSREKR